MFFRNIVGQTIIKQRLIQSVKDGFIPHAQLITGNQGTGTLILALAYIRYLYCTNRQEKDACGTCPSCQKFDKLVHPDLHFIFPIINKKRREDKKEALCHDFLPEWRNFVLTTPYADFTSWLINIGEENAQGLIYARESDDIMRKLRFKAYEADYKSVIIWLPEKMHETAASRLLKLLEEPPEKTVFLLVSEEPDKIIATICSRMQVMAVPPIADQDLFQTLQEKYDIPDQDIWHAIRLAEGSYEKATKILSSVEDNESYLNLFTTIMRNSWQKNILSIKVETDKFTSMSRAQQKKFLMYAQQMIRENFLYRLNELKINFMNHKENEFAIKFHPYVNETNVIKFMEEFSLAEQHIESNINPRMVFFDLSMKIIALLNNN
ncbi:ATP-binding protein [Candidatus Azobacteroides pseudotrichonymphae]|uniref:DNA polymerase III delta' subunit n=1 Tax=Azobacteroides pseudotrichonymphae genomovar. CFP2 TaxID=511995 RepID=B6YQP6_AZOPC|nr:DNA polymerase III subunit delta' [Candidatus Azobacteroides pseudotrichonymphae]BAG83518.1 DNA polymerase III delta' subunit [Candidatus Azobacteroides pseudotrichonymphae genomovar. CFP2]